MSNFANLDESKRKKYLAALGVKTWQTRENEEIEHCNAQENVVSASKSEEKLIASPSVAIDIDKITSMDLS